MNNYYSFNISFFKNLINKFVWNINRCPHLLTAGLCSKVQNSNPIPCHTQSHSPADIPSTTHLDADTHSIPTWTPPLTPPKIHVYQPPATDNVHNKQKQKKRYLNHRQTHLFDSAAILVSFFHDVIPFYSDVRMVLVPVSSGEKKFCCRLADTPYAQKWADPRTRLDKRLVTSPTGVPSWFPRRAGITWNAGILKITW